MQPLFIRLCVEYLTTLISPLVIPDVGTADAGGGIRGCLANGNGGCNLNAAGRVDCRGGVVDWSRGNGVDDCCFDLWWRGDCDGFFAVGDCLGLAVRYWWCGDCNGFFAVGDCLGLAVRFASACDGKAGLGDGLVDIYCLCVAWICNRGRVAVSMVFCDRDRRGDCLSDACHGPADDDESEDVEALHLEKSDWF